MTATGNRCKTCTATLHEDRYSGKSEVFLIFMYTLTVIMQRQNGDLAQVKSLERDASEI